MRDTDPKQDAPALGKKIERPPMPEPHKKIKEGVWRDPQGKLYTNAEPPPAPPNLGRKP